MPESRSLHDRFFLLLVLVVSVVFAWILRPYYGAVFWAAILAILFTPLFRSIVQSLQGRRTVAALLTETVIVLLVIFPAALLTSALMQEGLALYDRMRSGQFSASQSLQTLLGILPPWATGLLDRFGLTNMGTVQERLMTGLSKGVQVFAGSALDLGQNTLDFVIGFFIMLYLLFFLLRDGADLARQVRDAIPLRNDVLQKLGLRFAHVVRATVKGNIVIALVQGLLGGIAFWFLGVHAPLLWGVLMAFLSLLPAVGSALVWVPVAIYFIAIGSLWKGVGLLAFGIFVVGVVDNVLRPTLVGKDARMPDYMILVSTLGGMAVFGVNGFVIGPVVAAMFMATWHIVAIENSGAAPEQTTGAK